MDPQTPPPSEPTPPNPMEHTSPPPKSKKSLLLPSILAFLILTFVIWKLNGKSVVNPNTSEIPPTPIITVTPSSIPPVSPSPKTVVPQSWKPHVFSTYSLTLYAPDDWQSNSENFTDSTLIKFWKKSSPNIIPIQLEVKSNWENLGDAQKIAQNYFVGENIKAYRLDPPRKEDKQLDRYQTNVYFDFNGKVYVFQCVHNWENDYLFTCDTMLKTLLFNQ